MSSEIFRLAERELDSLLSASRAELGQHGIDVADGSAREAQVWAYSFSTDRAIGEDHHRIAITLTVRDDLPPMLQMFATSDRVTLRDEKQVAWSDLRRRGLFAVIEQSLATLQFKLQVKVGVDFAHDEIIRRCDVLLDLIGDDIPNAEALREQVKSWRLLAQQRALYSPMRRRLINNVNFGHLDGDARTIEEFYDHNIYRPLNERPPENLALRGDVAEAAVPEDRTVPRRVALLDRIPKAPPPDSAATRPMLALGILLVVVAVALLGFAMARHSWPFIAGSAVFLILVVRALWLWHK